MGERDLMDEARGVYEGLWANNYNADCADHERAEDVAEIASALAAAEQRGREEERGRIADYIHTRVDPYGVMRDLAASIRRGEP